MLPIENVTRMDDGRALRDVPASAPALTSHGSGPACVVLDTNTVLDWLVFGEPFARAVGAAITDGRLRWLASPRMVSELQAVLRRPLDPRWDRAREHALTIDVTKVALMCTEPAIASHQLLCRDPDDQVFIDLARAHAPDVLLTRDRALLSLRRRAATFGVQVATAVAWATTARLQ
jgi:predicted nucleic acid-binding protein